MAKKRGNNEGSINQRENGSWRAQATVDGHRLSFTGKTRKECQEWLKKTIRQIDEGMSYASTQVTFSAFMEDWLATSKMSMRPRTWMQYEQIFADYIKPALGKIKLRDLRPEHIQQMYNQLIDTGSSAYLVIKIHDILSSALTKAVKLSAIPRNPASLTQPPKTPEKEMMILTTSQISQLLITARGHRLETIIHLAVTTGLRQMELLGLKWTDLDWIKQTLKIERQLERPNGNGITFSAPKTRAGRRTIYLDNTTINTLRAHYDRQQIDRLAPKGSWTETGLIFCTSNGTPIHPRNLLRDFKLLLRDAGLPSIRFHDLRHTSASLLLNNGYSPLVVSKRLGHARTSITMDIYGHLHPSEEIEAAQKIGELITPISVAPGCTTLHPVAPELNPHNGEERNTPHI